MRFSHRARAARRPDSGRVRRYIGTIVQSSARYVGPEAARREALGDDDRAAVDQRRAERRDAADAVAQRQAIIQAVARPHVGEAGEPMAPGDDAMMADRRRLGQAGGAGGVDQQGAVGEAGPASLRSSASGAPENRSSARSIRRALVALAAMAPDFERQLGEGCVANLCERRFDDRGARSGDP